MGKAKAPWREIQVLFGLAFPVMLENLGQIFLGTVDTYFAGQIGDNAIAAINVTNMFTALFSAVFSSLGVGILVMISHALGEGNIPRACRILRQAVLLGVGIGAAVGLVSVLLRRPLLGLAGASGEILTLAQLYYAVVCGPCVFLCLTLLLSSGLKATQNTKASMRAALAANIANALMDALFIRLGLGVLGLGLATTLARVLNLLLLARMYRRGVGPLRLGKGDWRPEPALVKELAGYSGPILLTQLSARFFTLSVGALALHLGDLYYVTHSVAIALYEFACVPMVGFEAAVAALVSHALGAGRPRQATRYAFLSFFSAALCMTSLGAVIAFFALPLSALFTQTLAVQRLVKTMLSFMACFSWVSALAQVLTSAVQGMGDSRSPFLATFVGSLTLRLGGGYLLAYPLGWGLLGIWAGFVIDFVLRSIWLCVVFVRFARRAAAAGPDKEEAVPSVP